MIHTLLRTMRQVSKVLGQIVGHLCIRNFRREVLGKLRTGKTGPVSRPGTRFSVAACLRPKRSIGGKRHTLIVWPGVAQSGEFLIS
jgi:hypothetical protein